ncbi:MAG: helix-turn-helix domain-containing protein [Chloroflexota bacterium]
MNLAVKVTGVETVSGGYTPIPTWHGYSMAIRQSAIQHYIDGINLRRIACILGVEHHTVMNWSPPIPISYRMHPPSSYRA